MKTSASQTPLRPLLSCESPSRAYSMGLNSMGALPRGVGGDELTKNPAVWLLARRPLDASELKVKTKSAAAPKSQFIASSGRRAKSQTSRFFVNSPCSVFALAALFLAGLLLSGCKPQTAPGGAKVVADAAKRAAKVERDEFSGLKSATLSGNELSGGDAQGRPLWKLSAKTIRASGGLLGGGADALKTTTLLDARATLYNAGNPESTLQAPQILLFRTKKEVRLQFSKGMTGTTEGAYTGGRGLIKIAAPRADVDVNNRLISASGGVKMSQGAVQISAQTLRSRTSLQNVQLQGRVRAQNAQNGVVEAKTANYDWKNNRVAARTVSALRGETRLSGDVLNADTDASSGTLSGQVRAQSAQGQASAPRLDFNWKRDQITVRDATFTTPNGTLRAANLVTDSKLRLASAQGIVAQGDGATLRAGRATGFDGLSRLQAQNLDFRRGDTQFSAPRGTARKIGAKWVLEAQGGARGQNSGGKISAPRVIWDENRARVEASGGVTLQKDGATLRGQSLQSDTRFQNATLSGQVRGQLRDGSVLTAQTLEKRGAKFLAKSGATASLPARGSLGALTLRAAQIEASSDASGAISGATATGGVTLSSSTGATARAPRAIYNRQTATVTASGGVDFADPKRGIRTRGDTLIYHLDSNQAMLSYSRGQGRMNLFDGKKLF